MMIQQVTIIGGGSWATALVKIFSESGIRVSWLVRSNTTAQSINKQGYNPRYLSSVSMNKELVYASTDADKVLKDAQLVLFAVPSAHLASVLDKMNPDLLKKKQIAVSIKGFIPGTGKTPAHFLQKKLSLSQPVIVIGGPCHAEEVASGKSTFVTISGECSKAVNDLAGSLSPQYIRMITNNDPSGMEYASILKNIIGIATGIAGGLNYGDNFQAVLVSNAMRETDHLLQAVHPVKRDLYDSAYFGDLLVTAYSDHSRNRTLGKLIGRGIPVSKALQFMQMVAEGFHASKELGQLLKKISITVPVLTSVYRILHRHANPYREFKLLENQLC